MCRPPRGRGFLRVHRGSEPAVTRHRTTPVSTHWVAPIGCRTGEYRDLSCGRFPLCLQHPLWEGTLSSNCLGSLKREYNTTSQRTGAR